LRSDFAGFDEPSRLEKGRKRSAIGGAAEKRTPLIVRRSPIRFPLRVIWSAAACRRFARPQQAAANESGAKAPHSKGR